MQLQARGDHAAAFDQLALILTLSRNMRNNAVLLMALNGVRGDRVALEGINHWLKKVGPQPDLLRRALDELTRHEELLPPFADHVKAEYVAAVVNCRLGPPTAEGKSTFLQPEVNLLTLAWQVPWEQERWRRIVNAFFAGHLRAAEMPYWKYRHSSSGMMTAGDRRSRGRLLLENWMPAGSGEEMISGDHLARVIETSWLWPILPHWPPNHRQSFAEALTRLRATRLQLALALFQLEQGKPAQALEDLVPRYLAELPEDPMTGQPFSYRVSQGERYPLDEAEAPGMPGGGPPADGVFPWAGPEGGTGGMWPGGSGQPETPAPVLIIPPGQGIIESPGLGELVLVPLWPQPEREK
jgi:hypothetical protein